MYVRAAEHPRGLPPIRGCSHCAMCSIPLLIVWHGVPAELAMQWSINPCVCVLAGNYNKHKTSNLLLATCPLMTKSYRQTMPSHICPALEHSACPTSTSTL